ncbi:MAG: UDP-N-acetylglucosamine 2-epimerase [Bacteroidota bacterium]
MKRVLFITGTRADFGKLKSLISVVKNSSDFDYTIFCTGMHLLKKYGNTMSEIFKSGFNNVFPYINQVESDGMEMVLANTIQGLSRYIDEYDADLIVIHGDRVEALAGAIAGALKNKRVAHVEGGEITGTIDELIRHATSKMSHVHFVASNDARNRLLQLGETGDSIFQIGSPDIDVMLSDHLPDLSDCKKKYQINFNEYAIAIFHPVTNEEVSLQRKHAKIYVDSLLRSGLNYVVIYPNNDLGSEFIFEEIRRLSDDHRFKIFPSIRFEYFLTILKKAQFIIGNSSVGMHEAPVYGVPTVNLGSRQKNRFHYESIVHPDFNKGAIIDAIAQLRDKNFDGTYHYGDGKSSEKFLNALRTTSFWDIKMDKQLVDIFNKQFS